ncbi:6472_t:CDS:2 [Acaulospora colombiana]|uniref:6472_t:CDS:1 n=1 Tax=Acaulospora colombiana TaxID=27376 RepID=A0ACA9PDR1_9GLOM|nr:6472_t:CDS:2 [Acaulospora colombiana]
MRTAIAYTVVPHIPELNASTPTKASIDHLIAGSQARRPVSSMVTLLPRCLLNMGQPGGTVAPVVQPYNQGVADPTGGANCTRLQLLVLA